MEVVKKRKTQAIEANSSCYRWDELPSGALIEIAGRLSNFEDLEVLHFVCTRWHSVLRAYLCKLLDGGHMGCCRHQVPWLMMAQHQVIDIDERHGSTLCLRPCSIKAKAVKLFFYSMSFQRVRQMVIRLPSMLELAIVEGNFNNCLYSSHGWLLVVWKGSPMCLYNPFCGPTHNYIQLPKSDAIATCYVRRFTLSASPCTKSYTVVIAYGCNKMAFWRPGDMEWTVVEPRNFDAKLLPIIDVTFYRGYYYALDHKGGIFRLAMHDHHDGEKFRWNYEYRLPRGINGTDYPYLWEAYFLVESSKKLFVVVRVGIYPTAQAIGVLPHDYLTARFRVVEIVVSPGGKCEDAKEVNSLGNKTLFVGRNQAFTVEVPQEGVNSCDSYYYGCKPNCIYFTDDRIGFSSTAECGKVTDMGVYNMADGSIQRHFQGLSLLDYSPMMWVEPRC